MCPSWPTGTLASVAAAVAARGGNELGNDGGRQGGRWRSSIAAVAVATGGAEPSRRNKCRVPRRALPPSPRCSAPRQQHCRVAARRCPRGVGRRCPRAAGGGAPGLRAPACIAPPPARHPPTHPTASCLQTAATVPERLTGTTEFSRCGVVCSSLQPSPPPAQPAGSRVRAPREGPHATPAPRTAPTIAAASGPTEINNKAFATGGAGGPPQSPVPATSPPCFSLSLVDRSFPRGTQDVRRAHTPPDVCHPPPHSPRCWSPLAAAAGARLGHLLLPPPLALGADGRQ